MADVERSGSSLVVRSEAPCALRLAVAGGSVSSEAARRDVVGTVDALLVLRAGGGVERRAASDATLFACCATARRLASASSLSAL